jgi:hypothetical protein
MARTRVANFLMQPGNRALLESMARPDGTVPLAAIEVLTRLSGELPRDLTPDIPKKGAK